MDTKKMRWVSGNSVIEMSYIMPLFFSLFVIIIHTVFYYHDKAIIGGAAAESAVMGAQYVDSFTCTKPHSTQLILIDSHNGRLRKTFFSTYVLKISGVR